LPLVIYRKLESTLPVNLNDGAKPMQIDATKLTDDIHVGVGGERSVWMYRLDDDRTRVGSHIEIGEQERQGDGSVLIRVSEEWAVWVTC